MTSPREDFLIAMFQDDPRLVEALRNECRITEHRSWGMEEVVDIDSPRFNWNAVWAAILTFGVSSLFWTGIILAWLYRKGWL